MSENADDTPAAVRDRAWALHSFGRVDQAVEELRSGVVEFSGDALLWADLAWMHDARQEYGEAQRAVEQALALDPENPEILRAASRIALMNRDTARAHALIDRALELAPDRAWTHLQKARSYLGERTGWSKHGAAIKAEIDRALELAPEDAELLGAAGLELSRLSDGRRLAQPVMARALAISPNDAELQLLSSRINRENDALQVRSWSRILAQDPARSDLVRSIESTVWWRTRLVSAFALWTIPLLLLGAGWLVLLVGAAVISCANLWHIFVKLRVASPGVLWRTWTRPPWALSGALLAFLCAAAVLGAVVLRLFAPETLASLHWLLVALPLVILVAIILVRVVDYREEERTASQLSPDAARSYGQRRQSYLSVNLWFLLIGLATVSVMVLVQASDGSGEQWLSWLTLALMVAFSVPQLMDIAHLGWVRRRYVRGEGLHPAGRD